MIFGCRLRVVRWLLFGWRALARVPYEFSLKERSIAWVINVEAGGFFVEEMMMFMALLSECVMGDDLPTRERFPRSRSAS